MSFIVPHKAILSPEQLAAFKVSKTHQEIVSYIETLNSAVVGVKLTDGCSESEVRVLHSNLIQILIVIAGCQISVRRSHSNRECRKRDPTSREFCFEIRKPCVQDVL